MLIYLGLVGLALLVRRLHDTDMSGWWVLIGLVPFGALTLLIHPARGDAWAPFKRPWDEPGG